MERIHKLRIIFVTIITILQFSLISVKNNQMDSREFFKLQKDAEAVNYLKKGAFVKRTKNGYKLIDYDEIGYKQVESLSGKYYFLNTKMLYTFYKERYQEESLSELYEESGDADKILINYLLYIKGEEPIDKIGYFNYKIEKYEKLLNYLEKGKYKSKINLTFRLIIVIVLSIWLTFFFDERFEITSFFELLLIISFIENVLIAISPFKVSPLILVALFVSRLIFFLKEKEIKDIYKNFMAKNEFSKTLK